MKTVLSVIGILCLARRTKISLEIFLNTLHTIELGARRRAPGSNPLVLLWGEPRGAVCLGAAPLSTRRVARPGGAPHLS
jgi:hypothetical protein